MERKRFLAVVMTVMMVISMIPSMVFAAAPSGELGGKLKIKGLAAVGVSSAFPRSSRKDATCACRSSSRVNPCRCAWPESTKASSTGR